MRSGRFRICAAYFVAINRDALNVYESLGGPSMGAPLLGCLQGAMRPFTEVSDNFRMLTT